MSLWDVLTFHHDLYGSLAVLNAVHNLTAVDPRVIGAKVLDFQGGVTGDGWVVGQRDFVLVGAVDPRLPFRGYQQHHLLLLGNTAPLDSRGEGGSGGGGGHRVRGVDEVAGDGEGAPQEDPQRRRFRDADTQRVVRVCGAGTELLAPGEDHSASLSVLLEMTKSRELVCICGVAGEGGTPVPIGIPGKLCNTLSRAVFLKTPGLCTSRQELWNWKRVAEEGKENFRAEIPPLFLRLGYSRGYQAVRETGPIFLE